MLIGNNTLRNSQKTSQAIVKKGSRYFAVNSILPVEAILPRDICDWSILMAH